MNENETYYASTTTIQGGIGEAPQLRRPYDFKMGDTRKVSLRKALMLAQERAAATARVQQVTRVSGPLYGQTQYLIQTQEDKFLPANLEVRYDTRFLDRLKPEPESEPTATPEVSYHITINVLPSARGFAEALSKAAPRQ